ncbi:hypothetical protein Tco_0739690 [Tanacetum coccineum]
MASFYALISSPSCGQSGKQSLPKSAQDNIKNLSKNFIIDYALLVGQKEFIRFCVFDLLDSVPELLHKDFRFHASVTELLHYKNKSTKDKLGVVVFPISLVGDAWRWFDGIKGSITSWVDLTGNIFRKYYPPSRTGGINNLIIKWDPTNPKFENSLASKFVNYKTMDIFTKGALWNYWKLGSDESKPTNDETSDLEETNHDNKQEIGEIFRIETNLFDYRNTDYEWYEALEDNELKEEALKNKAIMEGTIDDDDELIDEIQEICSDETHEFLVCNIRRFEMIKYLFEKKTKSMLLLKEDEYDDFTSTSKDAAEQTTNLFT